MHLKSALLALTLCTAPLLAQAQGSTFQFTNTGTTALFDSATTYTGRIWGEYLNSAVPIKVNIYYVNLISSSTLAVTIPNGRRDFSSAPMDSVWYPTSLANSLEGSELNPGEADMDIYVNNQVNWYFGTDGLPASNQYDFPTVLLHEIGHGLGFLALAKLTDTVGSYGTITLVDIAPLTPSFPFPDLQQKHSVFSTFMENGAGQDLDDSLLFPNPSVLLGDEFTSNSVYFNGPLAMAYNSSNPVRLYAPTAWAPGSSLQHVNESTFPSSNPNSLMTPFVGTHEVHHSPGALTIYMLEDMGWNVNHDVGVENPLAGTGMEFFPNPVHNQAWLRSQTPLIQESLSIYDLAGKQQLVIPIHCNPGNLVALDLQSLAPGMYIGQLKGKSFRILKVN